MNTRNRMYNNDASDPQSRDSLTPEQRKITRWVLPSRSPEEEDQISLTFGGIPWNTLNACCKNSLLDYGQGNQRSLGHQMIKASPGRSNDKSKRYVVSEEEMAQNLLKMECTKKGLIIKKNVYFVNFTMSLYISCSIYLDNK